MACTACGTQPKWNFFEICKCCIEHSMEKECVICGCGPYAPMPHMRKVSLKVCACCKSQWYCSKKCQKIDWQFHKLFCATLPSMQETLFLEIFKDKRCTKCEKKPDKGKNFQKCSKCHTVRYCSTSCQRKNRREHKVVCERLSTLHWVYIVPYK